MGSATDISRLEETALVAVVDVEEDAVVLLRGSNDFGRMIGNNGVSIM